MKLVICYLAALVGFIWVLAWAWQMESAAWAEFSAANGCRIAQSRQSELQVGMVVNANGTVGTVVTSTEAQVGWLCNDGIIYWRAK